jgi:hypothetical protein
VRSELAAIDSVRELLDYVRSSVIVWAEGKEGDQGKDIKFEIERPRK